MNAFDHDCMKPTSDFCDQRCQVAGIESIEFISGVHRVGESSMLGKESLFSFSKKYSLFNFWA